MPIEKQQPANAPANDETNRDTDHILVIALGGLSDFVLALGAMAAIHQHHAQARITLMTSRAFVDLAQHSGCFDQIWEMPDYKWYETTRWIGLIHGLWSKGFNRVYDLHANKRTRTIRHLSPPKMRKNWFGRGKDADPKPTQHIWDRHVETLKTGGIKNVPFPDRDWMEGDVSYFYIPKDYALLVPGSAPLLADKRWPAIRYGALAQKLVQSGITPVILGTGAERETIAKICRICPEAINLIDKTTLFEITLLARDAVCAIGNNSGPIYLTAMAGCPSLVLFAAGSDPALSAPRGDKVVVLHSDNPGDLSLEDIYSTLTDQGFID
ncbi:MAG: glycosyltransferase family 9 protein [Pseudomonadota bacterium]